ncbi:MAG TPA: ABC transporter permease subunit, partial [Solirubrobacterales bacterium]|nr:ABC transporter permease subunit [Solirubrobacterales bacterium]
DLTKMMRALGAGRVQRLWRVEIPTALPYAFSGARVAITVSVIGAVFAEYVGSSEGLGHLINQAQAQLLTARSFAAVVVLSAMALGLFALVTVAERRIVTWDSRAATRS